MRQPTHSLTDSLTPSLTPSKFTRKQERSPMKHAFKAGMLNSGCSRAALPGFCARGYIRKPAHSLLQINVIRMAARFE